MDDKGTSYGGEIIYIPKEYLEDIPQIPVKLNFICPKCFVPLVFPQQSGMCSSCKKS